MVDGCDIAVNALDFKDRTPFVFDEVCSGKGIPVLHPYNFGWSGFLTVVRSKDRMLAELSSSPEGFELQVAEFAARHCASQDKRNQELEDVIRRYRTEKGQLPPPQLAIGSWLTAGLCVNAMYNITVGKPVNYFPQFYLSSMAVMDGEAPRSC